MPLARQKVLAATSACALVLPLAATGQDIEAEVVSLPQWQASYDDLYQGTSIDNLLLADVIGATGEQIGGVENVIFDADGNVVSMIAEIGGFLELGDTHLNVPWDEVEISADAVIVPVTEETAGDYSLFAEEMLTAGAAGEEIQQVEGDNFEVLETGPRLWRATEFIGDYVRIRQDEARAGYGYVNDLIIRDGAISAVVVRPDVRWAGPRGNYAIPYYGYRYGWDPGYAYYDLPYDEGEVAEIEPLDYDRFDGS